MTYLIAEGGINANGHLDWALKMCDQAKEAGCDAIKWQKKTPELIPEHMHDVPKHWEGETISYLEYKQRTEFGKHEYDLIALYCKKIGLDFSVSVWDSPSIDFISQYDLPWLKIPSAKATDIELIRKADGLGMPLIVSTGMTTEFEIEQTVPHISRRDGAMLMHCNSCYPADESELNLSYIPILQGKFSFPVGYSSHTTSPFPAITAVAVGAIAVEAHLTLDRSLEGSDHAASLELKGMKLLRREIDRVSVVLGRPEKKVWPSELPSRLKLRGY